MAEKGVRVRIVSESVGKGFKDAQKSLGGLQSAAKKLAGAAGIGLSATAVLNFGKNAVKAFAENEKSAARLAGVVKNLGLAFETPMIEKNLDEISAKYGYQGEVLREAYQKLITVTGSATKSQDLLNLSLDVSAGSGQDLVTVNQDLAALYVGNTKGLKKYNLGLTATELKTLKYEDAVALLAKTFKGSANGELDTFSGKMRVLGEAAGNAQEIIGKGLIDALSMLGGSGDNIEGLSSAMTTFATDVANAARGIGVLVEKLKSLPGVDSEVGKGVSNWIKLIGPLAGLLTAWEGLTRMGAASIEAVELTSTNVLSGDVWLAQNKARLAAEAEAAKRAKELAALQEKAARAQAKAAKDALKQKQLSKIFDLQYIQIYAALQGKLSEEDRNRLRLQLAILDENVDAAISLANKLADAQGKTSTLASFLRNLPDAKNPFDKWSDYLKAVELEAKRIGALTFNAPSAAAAASTTSAAAAAATAKTNTPPVTNPQTGAPTYGVGGSLGLEDLRGRSSAVPTINIVVDLDGQTVGGAVRDSSINDSLSGSFNTVNRTGRFGLSGTQ